jgi:hypothetical protein
MQQLVSIDLVMKSFGVERPVELSLELTEADLTEEREVLENEVLSCFMPRLALGMLLISCFVCAIGRSR